ncbi:hypothetical protein [Desulfobacter sp.]|uniref:hypothetical protein n=1 Tax=Desulfobacter sp. TaxID=2294 RepID=UPI003D14288C
MTCKIYRHLFFNTGFYFKIGVKDAFISSVPLHLVRKDPQKSKGAEPESGSAPFKFRDDCFIL